MKIKRIKLSPQLLSQMFVKGNKINVEIIEGLPTDFDCRGAKINADFGIGVIEIYGLSSEFEEFEGKAEDCPVLDVVIKDIKIIG